MRQPRARFSPSRFLALCVCVLPSCASNAREQEIRAVRDDVVAVRADQASDRQKMEALRNALLMLQERVETLGAGIEEARKRSSEIPPAAPPASSRKAGHRGEPPSPPGEAREGPAQIYRRAYDRLHSDDSQGALEGFRRILEDFPRHALAPNARYWSGEAYYARKDYTRAAGEFRRVIQDYPKSAKVPDALLKEGYALRNLGEPGKARGDLEEILRSFPESPAAQKAREKIREWGEAPAGASAPEIGNGGTAAEAETPSKEAP